MTKEEKQKQKIIDILDAMKSFIIEECEDGRHIGAITGTLGDKFNNRAGREIFKEWLEKNNIKYEGNVVN